MNQSIVKSFDVFKRDLTKCFERTSDKIVQWTEYDAYTYV